MSQNGDQVVVESLMISLSHNKMRGQTEVTFVGEGFDAENDDIIVDILAVAAEALGHIILPKDQVIIEEP